MEQNAGSVNVLSIIANGEVCIGQKRLNEYLAVLPLREAKVDLVCETENLLRVRLDTKAHGIIHLLLNLEKLYHDSTKTFIQFKLLERRMEGNALKAMLFGSMPNAVLNFLMGIFALPKTIKGSNDGDVFTIDFHEWLMQSPLAEFGVMGMRWLDCIKITGAEVDAGQVKVIGAINYQG